MSYPRHKASLQEGKLDLSWAGWKAIGRRSCDRLLGPSPWCWKGPPHQMQLHRDGRKEARGGVRGRTPAPAVWAGLAQQQSLSCLFKGKALEGCMDGGLLWGLEGSWEGGSATCPQALDAVGFRAGGWLRPAEGLERGRQRHPHLPFRVDPTLCRADPRPCAWAEVGFACLVLPQRTSWSVEGQHLDLQALACASTCLGQQPCSRGPVRCQVGCRPPLSPPKQLGWETFLNFLC